jgi:hypothetical protein
MLESVMRSETSEPGIGSQAVTFGTIQHLPNPLDAKWPGGRIGIRIPC